MSATYRMSRTVGFPGPTLTHPIHPPILDAATQLMAHISRNPRVSLEHYDDDVVREILSYLESRRSDWVPRTGPIRIMKYDETVLDLMCAAIDAGYEYFSEGGFSS